MTAPSSQTVMRRYGGRQVSHRGHPPWPREVVPTARWGVCAGWPHTPHCGDPFSGGSEGTECGTGASSERTAAAPFLPGRGPSGREEESRTHAQFSGRTHTARDVEQTSRQISCNSLRKSLDSGANDDDVIRTISRWIADRRSRSVTAQEHGATGAQPGGHAGFAAIGSPQQVRPVAGARVADQLRDLADGVFGRNAHSRGEVDEILGIRPDRNAELDRHYDENDAYVVLRTGARVIATDRVTAARSGHTHGGSGTSAPNVLPFAAVHGEFLALLDREYDGERCDSASPHTPVKRNVKVSARRASTS